MTLTLRKLDELIKDENGANREYGEMARTNPKYKKWFTSMASDERKHAKYLTKMKKDLNIAIMKKIARDIKRNKK